MLRKIEGLIASKWLKTPVLLSGEEMEGLLQELGEGSFYLTGSLVEEGELSVKDFTALYQKYLEDLKGGAPLEPYRLPFSSVWSASSDCLYQKEIKGKYLLKPILPAIQLRFHAIHYSSVDGEIRSMTQGIPWGIEFSYPTLMQNADTGQIEKVQETFVNSAPFKRLQRWLRHKSAPVRFRVEGEEKRIPIRLGKGCFSWIDTHPNLGKLEVVR